MEICKKLQASRKHRGGRSTRLSGEDHPGAVLTSHDAELMREMHEEFELGEPGHLGYRKLAMIFGISRNAAENCCRYKTY